MDKNILIHPEDVLGSVVPQKTSKQFFIYREFLEKSFVYNESVIYCFCSYCGSLIELNKTIAKELAEVCGMEDGREFRGIYFEVEKCIVCDNDYVGVQCNIIEKTPLFNEKSERT